MSERPDPLLAWDDDRRRCPVAHDPEHGWTVHGHPEALAVLHDPATFSSRVSVHLSVPNGMDPPEDGAYRELVAGWVAARRDPDAWPVDDPIVGLLAEPDLRARGPLVANRRVVARPITLGGHHLEPGGRLTGVRTHETGAHPGAALALA